MRVTALFFILLCCSISYTTAQNDYLVATSPSQEISSSKEELCIKENFPLQLLCKWAPGMKFMFVPSQRDMFLPTLSYEKFHGYEYRGNSRTYPEIAGSS